MLHIHIVTNALAYISTAYIETDNKQTGTRIY